MNVPLGEGRSAGARLRAAPLGCAQECGAFAFGMVLAHISGAGMPAAGVQEGPALRPACGHRSRKILHPQASDAKNITLNIHLLNSRAYCL